jgi:hypothetical protein
MPVLIIECPSRDSPEARSVGQGGSAALLTAMREGWEKGALAGWKASSVPPESLYLRVTTTVPGAREDSPSEFSTDEIWITTDETLFLQLLEVYLRLGARGHDELRKMISTASDDKNRAFLWSSLWWVERLLAGELAAIESDASALALETVRLQIGAVSDQINRFKVATKSKFKLELSDAERDRFFDGLKLCFKLQSKYAYYAAEAKARDNRDSAFGVGPDPKSLRKREPYRQTILDLWQGKMAEVTPELARAHEEVYGMFPPALLVLGDLKEDLNFRRSAQKQRELGLKANSDGDIEFEYFTLIRARLVEMRNALLGLEASLGREGIAPIAEAALKGRRHIALDASDTPLGSLPAEVIGQLSALPPGVTAYLKKLVVPGFAVGIVSLRKVASLIQSQNRVLVNMATLQNLLAVYDDSIDNPLRRGVLQQYLFDLERVQTSARIADKQSERFWGYITLGLAVASLIVAAASLPFGVGAPAVPAALSTIIVLLNLGLAAVGIILAVRGIVSLVDQNLQNDLKMELLSLGIRDPESLAEFGSLLHHHREIANAATTGLLKELIIMASAAKLPALGHAFALKGHYDDVDSIMNWAE